MNVELFPDRVLRCMTAADRRAIGQPTGAESSARYAARLQRDEQRLFAVWLYRHELDGELVWNQQAMHKRSTGRSGFPDFCVFKDGRCLALEFKAPGAKLTAEQTIFANRFESQRISFAVNCEIRDEKFPCGWKIETKRDDQDHTYRKKNVANLPCSISYRMSVNGLFCLCYRFIHMFASARCVRLVAI